MSHDREALADEILRTIEYGHLPFKETEQRLQRIINDELAGSIFDEYNETKVELCTSLLYCLYVNNSHCSTYSPRC